MQAHEIDALKSTWLDQSVTIAGEIPELLRFAGRTGVVKSVNWNGHCLVEWDAGQDVGWYDIDPQHLSIVDSGSPATESDPASSDARSV